jgi:hypothetical protein
VLILAGVVAVVIGYIRASGAGGLANGGPLLLVGVAAALLGTLEVTLREHLSGYRSHAIMLAALPVLIFHSAVILGISRFTHVPPLLNVGVLALDLALFLVLFKVLRRRFLDGRARRVSGR